MTGKLANAMQWEPRPYGARMVVSPTTNLLRIDPKRNTSMTDRKSAVIDEHGLKDHPEMAVERVSVLSGPIAASENGNGLVLRVKCDCDNGSEKITEYQLVQDSVVVLARHRGGFYHSLFNNTDEPVIIEARILAKRSDLDK